MYFFSFKELVNLCVCVCARILSLTHWWPPPRQPQRSPSPLGSLRSSSGLPPPSSVLSFFSLRRHTHKHTHASQKTQTWVRPCRSMSDSQKPPRNKHFFRSYLIRLMLSLPLALVLFSLTIFQTFLTKLQKSTTCSWCFQWSVYGQALPHGHVCLSVVVHSKPCFPLCDLAKGFSPWLMFQSSDLEVPKKFGGEV